MTPHRGGSRAARQAGDFVDPRDNGGRRAHSPVIADLEAVHEGPGSHPHHPSVSIDGGSCTGSVGSVTVTIPVKCPDPSPAVSEIDSGQYPLAQLKWEIALPYLQAGLGFKECPKS